MDKNERPKLTPEQAARPLYVRDIGQLMEAIAPVIGDYMMRAFKPVAEKIRELENRPIVKYCGVWERDRQYEQGNLVTHGGCIHHCNVTTRQQPGTCGDWTLAVKSGRDGKDLR